MTQKTMQDPKDTPPPKTRRDDTATDLPIRSAPTRTAR